MKGNFSIGQIVAASGEKKSGWIPVGDRPSSAGYSVPLTIINGVKEGPVVAITAGQNGTEYVGIAAALEITKRVKPSELSGAILVVPVVNVLGFEQRERYTFPLDDDFNGKQNMWSLWPGRSDGSLLHKNMRAVFDQVVRRGQYYLDMHGGDIHEYLIPCTMITLVGDPKVDSESRNLARAVGYEYLIEAPTADSDRGTTKTEASLSGIPSVVVETGDQGVLRQDLVEKAVSGIMNVMKLLNMVEGPPSSVKSGVKEIYKMIPVRAEIGGLFVQRIPAGAMVKKGDKIGEVISIDGNKTQEVIASETGLIIESFCNPAVYSGDALCEIALLKP